MIRGWIMLTIGLLCVVGALYFGVTAQTFRGQNQPQAYAALGLGIAGAACFIASAWLWRKP